VLAMVDWIQKLLKHSGIQIILMYNDNKKCLMLVHGRNNLESHTEIISQPFKTLVYSLQLTLKRKLWQFNIFTATSAILPLDKSIYFCS
jgi:hypothetical protein